MRTYIPTRVSNPIDLAVDAAKTSSNRGRVGGRRTREEDEEGGGWEAWIGG